MLGKLLKYEYRATYKLYLILYIIVLALAGIKRLFYTLDLSNNVILKVFSGTVTVSIVLSCAGLYFATLIFTLFRFYKNLFTDEGYLMFTLPVSPMKLIISKIITGMTWVLSSILIISAAIAIMLFRTSTLDSILGLWDMFGSNIFDMMFDGQMLQFIMYILSYVTQIFSTVCFIYLAVAFGQQIMPRHKIGGSILSYFIISMASGTISSVLSLIYYGISGFDLDSTNLPASFYSFSIIMNLAFAIVSIAMINNICKKHLNLS